LISLSIISASLGPTFSMLSSPSRSGPICRQISPTSCSSSSIAQAALQ
jgi:hypothetical protein